jgi:cyclin ccl1
MSAPSSSLSPIPDLFLSSTHCRHWLLDSTGLHMTRVRAQACALQRLHKSVKLELSNEPLTLDDERQLRLHYTQQLIKIATDLKLPTDVIHCAVIFFKRFYLGTSVMEYPPKDVVYCSLFVACKAEEHYITLDQMLLPSVIDAPARAQTKEKVIKLETHFLTHIKFHLRIFHLSHALRGIISEFELLDSATCSVAVWMNVSDPKLTQKNAPGSTLQTISELFSGERSSTLFQMALLSDDLIFFSTPSQIALAILYSIQQGIKTFSVPHNTNDSRSHSLDLVERFIQSQTAQQEHIQTITQSLNRKIKEINSMINDAEREMQVAREDTSGGRRKLLKSIEKKRKACSNPLFDSESKLEGHKV